MPAPRRSVLYADDGVFALIPVIAAVVARHG